MNAATSSVHSGFVSFQANVEEISGFSMMTCVLPMRKIMSIIWKPALKNKKRMPSTLVDCLEGPKMKNVASHCRPGLVVVLGLALVYSLFVLMYMLPPQTKEEGDSRNIEVTRYMSSKTVCGLGCNVGDVASNTNTRTAGLVAVDNPASRWPLPECSRYFNNVNEFEIGYKVHTLEFRGRKNIKAGGYFKPQICQPRSKVAIIVPYRDRETNLLVFLYNIHPFLVKQMLQYRIFVIEQSGHEKFNKGRLLNAGFDLAARLGSWDCLVFHDVNLVPLFANTSYSCPIVPTQMSTSVLWRKQTYPYESSFGGVTSITDKHFRAVNGYSNLYWGSVGADASNMFFRLRAARIPIQKYENVMGLYMLLPDPTQKNITRYKQMSTGNVHKKYKTDGLSNSIYKTISITLRSLYTHVVVDINPNKDLIE